MAVGIFRVVDPKPGYGSLLPSVLFFIRKVKCRVYLISITVLKLRSEFSFLFVRTSFVVFVKERSNPMLTWLIPLTLLSVTSFSRGK